MTSAESIAGSVFPAEHEITRSLIVPVYLNAENIPYLVEAVNGLAQSLSPGFEVIFVVDGSPDNSGELLIAAQERLACSSIVVFHSRNFGSFAAIRTGIEIARGVHIAAMAADLQEPPELILRFFEILEKDDADIVFGKRIGRNDPALRAAAATIFWRAYRRFVIKEMPKGGVDIFGFNSQVRDVVLTIQEPNSSLIAQLFWVGFRRAFVPYIRQRRQHGKSAWNLSRRLRYMMDSIFSNSDTPILLVLWIGLLGCIGSFFLGVLVVVLRLAGLITVPGYAALMLVTLFFGSSILLVQGIVGCYLWRTFENTKRRPLRIISRVVSSKE
jgi:glycosyltransferase involved in cell wall biosynthesis